MRNACPKLCEVLGCLLVLALPAQLVSASRLRDIQLTPVGTYSAGVFNEGAAEIVAHDSRAQRLFVVNGATSSIDVLDFADPAAPSFLFSISLAPYGGQANSVAVKRGVVAAAVQSEPKTDPGKVVFFDAAAPDETQAFISAVEVGALPDMLTFTSSGRFLLVANEGEPNDDYTIDPEGSVSIIDMRGGAARVTQGDVRTATFAPFNGAMLDPSIRIFGPGASVAQDLEPEYIAVSHDSETAWVTLQENNALGILNIREGVFTELRGLGFKDHSLSGNPLDASDRDNAINIANWPVFGMYQPDAIASFSSGGDTFLITANEGDAREYGAFTEEVRVGSLNLDPTIFPDPAFLKNVARLGRLGVTKTLGDPNGDGVYDALYAFGTRSFSIRNAAGALVFDSGDQLEQITAQALPTFFNSNNDSNTSFDSRSDNKGPEPEGVTTAKLYGRTYAFIGLERIGGVLVYNITVPTAPRFIQFVNNRDFSGNAAAGTAGDLGPEGLLFIRAGKSPNHKPLLVVANEVSGTTTVYEISRVDK